MTWHAVGLFFAGFNTCAIFVRAHEGRWGWAAFAAFGAICGLAGGFLP